MDDEDLDAPWPAIFSAELWGIIKRLNRTYRLDRDETQYRCKTAFQEAIERDGSFGVATKMKAVLGAATYRRPNERVARTRAALAEVWGSRWLEYIDELFGE